MIRPILKYGDDPLHELAAPVQAITPDVQQLIDDMVATMYAAPGIGLAATQVGVPLRVFVVDVSVGRDPKGLIVAVNPEFIERDGEQLEEEGCLSLPGFNATVLRPAHVILRALDRSGDEVRHEATGLLARAFQHEMDHLDGLLFMNHLRGIKREMMVRKIRKLAKAGKW
jgi:peptide deformylase